MLINLKFGLFPVSAASNPPLGRILLLLLDYAVSPTLKIVNTKQHTQND
jgi:hypothetical protein